MRMFRHVKMMKDGWLNRYVINIIGTVICFILALLLKIFANGYILKSAMDLIDIVITILIIIFGFILLLILNHTLAKYDQPKFTNANRTLTDLNIIPKMYDRFFTFFVSVIIVAVLSLGILFQNAILDLAISDIVYFITLFNVASLTLIIMDLHDLKKLYKMQK